MANQPPTTTVRYYTSQVDATNDVNPIPLSYTCNGNQTIYMRVVNPTTGCFVIKSFQLLLTAPPVANTVPDVKACATPQGGPVMFNLPIAATIGFLGV